MPRKGHSESIWACGSCERNDEVISSYEEIQNSGIPICLECGEDMEFIAEYWVEDKQTSFLDGPF